MDDVAALVATRLASPCLRRGRPRRLTYDDRMIRAASSWTRPSEGC